MQVSCGPRVLSGRRGRDAILLLYTSGPFKGADNIMNILILILIGAVLEGGELYNRACKVLVLGLEDRRIAFLCMSAWPKQEQTCSDACRLLQRFCGKNL